jgi:hypothetical protein
MENIFEKLMGSTDAEFIAYLGDINAAKERAHDIAWHEASRGIIIGYAKRYVKLMPVTEATESMNHFLNNLTT